MAVELTRQQLAVALRIVASETDAIDAGIASVLDRALAAATTTVERYAPAAPVAIQDEAAVRLASVLYDRAGHEGRGGNPFVQSGAAFLLSPHRTRSVVSAGTPTPRAEM